VTRTAKAVRDVLLQDRELRGHGGAIRFRARCRRVKAVGELRANRAATVDQSVDAGTRPEHVVERAVFEHENNDVLNPRLTLRHGRLASLRRRCAVPTRIGSDTAVKSLRKG